MGRVSSSWEMSWEIGAKAIAGQSDGEERPVWLTKSVCSWSKFLKQKLWHERYWLPATSQEIRDVVADASLNPRWKSILREIK